MIEQCENPAYRATRTWQTKNKAGKIPLIQRGYSRQVIALTVMSFLIGNSKPIIESWHSKEPVFFTWVANSRSLHACCSSSFWRVWLSFPEVCPCPCTNTLTHLEHAAVVVLLLLLLFENASRFWLLHTLLLFGLILSVRIEFTWFVCASSSTPDGAHTPQVVVDFRHGSSGFVAVFLSFSLSLLDIHLLFGNVRMIDKDDTLTKTSRRVGRT